MTRRLLLLLACVLTPAIASAQLPSSNVRPPVFIQPASAVNGGGVFNGQLLCATDGTAAAPCFSFAAHTGDGMWYANGLQFSSSGNAVVRMIFASSSGLLLHQDIPLSWGSSGVNTPDTFFYRRAARNLLFADTTNAYRLDVANTYTSNISNEVFSVDWQTSANVATVGTRTAATGTGRQLKLVAQASSGGAFGSLTLDTNGTVTPSGSIVTAAGGLTVAPITITNGTNLTTATANAVENDGVARYFTHDTTNGRKVDDEWNFFELTGDGTGITTIADFFGASGSGIPLVSGGRYEIEWHCVFTQATAGTATWTIVTATTALAILDAGYVGTNIAGGGTVGAPQTAWVNTTGSSSTALPVTGTEATGVTHQFDVHAVVTAGAGASNTRLRLTMSAGTATPKAGSYIKVRRLPAANAGTFVS